MDVHHDHNSSTTTQHHHAMQSWHLALSTRISTTLLLPTPPLHLKYQHMQYPNSKIIIPHHTTSTSRQPGVCFIGTSLHDSCSHHSPPFALAFELVFIFISKPMTLSDYSYHSTSSPLLNPAPASTKHFNQHFAWLLLSTFALLAFELTLILLAQHLLTETEDYLVPTSSSGNWQEWQ